MEAIQNLKMVEAARTEASRLLDEDSSFSNHPQIKTELSRRESQKIHFE